MIDTLDETTVATWARQAADALQRRRAEIDSLNVFPVPDSDTGSNMAVTMQAGSDAVLDANGQRGADTATTWPGRGPLGPW